jgi:putative PIN family toxin of toxin-antitoxin system
MSETQRVVFDCNTLLQGMASPGGPAGRCVQLALDQRIHLFVSPAGLGELRDVCNRPKVAHKLHLTAERVEAFLEAIELAATSLEDVPERFTYDRDPDDAHYVNLALAADARLIVTRDKDLLDLMVMSLPEASDFRSRFPQLRILTPPEFLKEVESEVA